MANINYIKPDKLEDFSVWCSKKYPLWCKSNFPFIEGTFEALDTYGLICKIVQYLNETKQNLNTTEDNVQNIYDFVTNYFDNLDVQKEINNKLDEMKKTGDLQLILDNLFDELKSETNLKINRIDTMTNNSINEQNNIINEQNQKINTIENMSRNTNSLNPLFASSIENMTDTTKIYVNTSDGNWYYHNGNTWTIGGRFVSNGISLESIDIDMTNFIKRGKQLYNKNTVKSGYISHNSGNVGANDDFRHSDYILINPNTNYHLQSTYSEVQLAFYDENKTYISGMLINKTATITSPNNAKFTRFSLHKNNYLTAQFEEGDSYTGPEEFYYYIDFLKALDYNQKIINEKEVSFISPTQNIFTYVNIIMGAYIAHSTGNLNYDVNFFATDYIELKNTETSISINNSKYCQLAFYDENKLYISGYYEANNNNTLNLAIPENAKYLRFSSYKIRLDSQMIVYGNSLPSVYVPPYKINLYQIEEMERKIETTFNNIRHCGIGYEFETLKEAIQTLTEFENITLYVHEGIYNLYNEFGGDSFFDNYNASINGYGLVLKNNIHVIFSSGAKVVFNYTGNNSEVHSKFSPFNSAEKGFILENANIECSNCRYCVHDERANSLDSYINKYKNCIMNIDNTQNPNWHTNQSIGGGLGHNGEIIIDGNIFGTSVSYHNNASSSDISAKSNIIVKNNYFKTGTIRMSNCGVSTEKTNVIICNNSVPLNIIVNYERPDIDVIENMEVYQFNNEIRQ